jgi:DNA polymerase I-like protein with 3'-5' exonuclease and polymerase domains
MNLLKFLKERFDHILIIDYEFSQTPGNNPNPVCLTASDLVTGQTRRVWFLENDPWCKFPFPIERSLLVAHNVSAEASCLLAHGIKLPKYWYCTFVEELKFSNGLRVTGYTLVDCCKRFGIKTITEGYKEKMRNLILGKYPNYTDEEKHLIQQYNDTDVEMGEALFLNQLERAEKQNRNFKEFISQAIFHGRSKALCAKIERNGIPINMDLHNDLETYYPQVRKAEMEELNKKLGIELYVDYKKKLKAFEELLKRENLYDVWPKTETGKCKTDDRTLYRFQEVNPKIKLIRNAAFIIDAKKLKGVCMGSDNRSRSDLKMFMQITGRTNVSTKESPFGAPRRMRNLVGTDKEHILVYADWKSQEAVIQAALSKDPQMIKAVESGDPYIWTAIKCRAAPPGATKKGFEKVRQIYKDTFLALAYQQTPVGLNAKLENSMSEAYHLHEQLEQLYSEYFNWSEKLILNSVLRGYFKTKFGWRYHITSSEYVNPRRLANWPLQSHGSEILRMAIIDLDEAGFEISMPVHDAVLIHLKRKSCAAYIRRLKYIMSNAAYKVIGWKIPVDIKIIRKQYHQDKEDQKLWNDLYSKILKFKEGDLKTDSLSVIHSAPSDNQSTVYYN